MIDPKLPPDEETLPLDNEEEQGEGLEDDGTLDEGWDDNDNWLENLGKVVKGKERPRIFE